MVISKLLMFTYQFICNCLPYNFVEHCKALKDNPVKNTKF